MSQRLFIFSDLHIHSEQDSFYTLFLRELRDLELAFGDCLILAGDVFDVFVGSQPYFYMKYKLFFVELSRLLGLGVELHYIEGNHDFHLRALGGLLQGIHIHSEFLNFTWNGKNFYICHGDTIDQKNYAYRLMRLFFRSNAFKVGFKLLPHSFCQNLGQRMSHLSRRMGALRALKQNDTLLKKRPLKELFRNYAALRIVEGADYVVAGHSHDLDEFFIQMGPRKAQYINVGYPPKHLSYLYYGARDSFIVRRALGN